MAKRNIIVIGASAGGFEVLKEIVSDFPADFDAAVFIVWHMSPDVRGILPHALSRVGKLPAANARDHESIKNGRIYVAPPDHHMILEKDTIRISRGPKENRFRPAIDPLFRSAAFSHKNRVIGVILSGALDDGTAGLWAIKQRGGIAVVQEPGEAEVPQMPESAIAAVHVDYILPAADIGSKLIQLTEEEVKEINFDNMEANDKIKNEIKASLSEAASDYMFLGGKLTPYTCPECHGVLSSIKEGGRLRFRCHTGHAFSADSLLAAISESIEESFWSTIRNVQESVFLLNHMGDHFAEVNEPRIAANFFKKAQEARKNCDMIRKIVFEHEQLSIDKIEDEVLEKSEIKEDDNQKNQ